MTSKLPSSKTNENKKSTSSALDGDQSTGSHIHGRDFGAFILRKRKRVKGGEGYSLHDGVCLSVRQASKEAEKAGPSVALERSLVMTLGGLFKGE